MNRADFSWKEHLRNAFHEPLRQGDTAARTVGCRHTNPAICAKHSLEGVCAFVRKDGMCLSPPRSWPKQFVCLSALG